MKGPPRGGPFLFKMGQGYSAAGKAAGSAALAGYLKSQGEPDYIEGVLEGYRWASAPWEKAPSGMSAGTKAVLVPLDDPVRSDLVRLQSELPHPDQYGRADVDAREE
jgi:hypothetical protein